MVAALLLALLTTASPSRHLVAIGNNAGDTASEPLRFAEQDARSVAEVFSAIGHTPATQVQLVLGGTAGQVRAALKSVEEQLAHEPSGELIIYYSGHADEGSLQLASTRLPLQELLDVLKSAHARLGLLIVDACRSGTLTRLKGLVPAGVKGAKDVQVEDLQVRGRVVISASGADEYAQESEALGGSYFTHYLLNGLRGAADASHDGAVSLEEAYGYAYAQTLSSTFATRGGVQHPSFSLDLKGSGDVVLTEPRGGRTQLALRASESTEWMLNQREGSFQVGPFLEAPGESRLFVPPGVYTVQARRQSRFYEAELTVPESGVVTFEERGLRPVRAEYALNKGGPTPWTASLSVGSGTAVLDGFGAPYGAELELERRPPVYLGTLNVMGLGLSAASATALGPLPLRDTELEGRLFVGHHEQLGRLAIRAHLAVDATVVVETGGPLTRAIVSAAPGLKLGVDVGWTLVHDWALFARVEGGASLVDTALGERVRWPLHAAGGTWLRF